MTETPPRNEDEGHPDAEIDRRFRELTSGLEVPFSCDGAAAGERPGRVVRPSGSPQADDARTVRPLGPRDFVVDDAVEDEDGWEPPEPDPFLVQDGRRVLAALLAVLPLLAATAAGVLGRQFSALTLTALGLLTLTGVAWSVQLLPRHRDPEDPGAVV